jgi:mRNA interferase YafQ
MFEIVGTTQFKKDLKRIKKRSQPNFEKLTIFIKHLAESGFKGIAPEYKPHYLKGTYKDCCECHVKTDLLLIWHEKEKPNVIVLVRAGTHSDLF